MSDTKLIQSAFSDFISTPTTEKLQALNLEAEAYRERWIESRSRVPPTPSVHHETEAEKTTRYKRVMAVHGNQPDGTELVLALQSRTSKREGKTWFVVSWRSRLSPGGHNRRFYLTAGQAWSMPADLALQMFESLRAQGGLEARFDDTQRRPDFRVSVDLSLTDLTMEGETWGARTRTVVLTDPHAQWRKVMLFDPDTRIVTFRSLTKDNNYMPRTDLRPACEWFLDNSMQDMNVQQARVFFEALQTFLAAA
jgi:hypothetical protein